MEGNLVLQMAKDLDAILDRGEAEPVPSCKTEAGSVSYLKQIICPIYETMKAVSGFVFEIFWFCVLPLSVSLIDFGAYCSVLRQGACN